MQRNIIPDIVPARDVIALDRTATVFDGAQAMRDHNVSAVAVTDDDGRLVGTLSERDLVRRVLADGLNPQTTAIADIMTETPEALRPDDNALDAAELMLSRAIRHLPVVDDGGKVVAMVSMRDLLKAALSDLNADMDAARDAAFAPEDA